MAETEYVDSLEAAREMDAADGLRHFRDQFWIPSRQGVDEIYFVGNSLGLQPRHTADYVQQELASWQQRGVRGHFEGSFPWMPYHQFLSEGFAALVGCQPSEAVVMNSLTTNLHLMMASFYQPQAGRAGILIEHQAFPSDHYAAESQIRFHGFDPQQWLFQLKPVEGKAWLETAHIIAEIQRLAGRLALVLLPGVQYYTGQRLDMAAICRACQECGVAIGLDLAHAIGNVPLELHEWGADFAVWCTYKYLNSGPGSVGGCFVHQRYHGTELPRLAGWWGHESETRFEMSNEFRPTPTVEAWQLSNPPILSLAAIRASLDMFQAAGGIQPLVEKSARLTGFLAWLVQKRLAGKVEILTPLEPGMHGCQLSLKIIAPEKNGEVVHRELEAAGAMTDWRQPDVIRAAPVPLYNRFEDVFRFVELLERQLSG